MTESESDFWTWASPDGLHDQYLELLEGGTLSDSQVHCGKRIWKVHKAILCVRSKWFKKALTGPFKESETGIVKIREFEENEVDCLLHYIYTGKVNVRKHFPGKPGVTASIPIWKLGDFFCLEGLCKLALQGCDEYFRRKGSVYSVTETWQFLTQEVINNIIHLVQVVYKEKRKDVRETFKRPVLAFLLSSIHFLSQREVFRDLIRKLPEFASDWAMALTSSMGSTKMPKRSSDKCAKCRKSSSKSINLAKWIKEQQAEMFCQNCFSLPRLEDWTGESSKSA